MIEQTQRRGRTVTARLWISCLAMAVLAGCGGGGGDGNALRADPPPASVPPPAPPPPVVSAPNPRFSKHIELTNAAPAQAAGLNGSGIRIGVLDSGVNRQHPALAGRVAANLNYVNPANNNLQVDDVVGHGTAVAQIIAGRPFGEWPGGIAPQATIVSARIISDKPPADDGSGQGNEIDGAIGLKPIHQDLIDRGVRVMNNSWGGLYWTNPAATAAIADEYRPFVITHGGLVVFSTGNSSFANPSSLAALPSQTGTGGGLPAADLERGWLAVAALDSDNPTQLAAYSNACGAAQRYCLAAPGSVVVTGTSDAPNAPSYWNWQGTSFSAPLVSGAAALVWQAFPYFDNDLVRQTLLGTARDLGAPGVDAVFGYGALDIGAAARGPARLDWGDVTARFDGTTSTWSNRIVGNGGIVKQGSGTLVLSADNAYAGRTQALGGTLAFAATVPGDAAVGAGANLRLGGGVNGNLDNGGTVTIAGDAGARAIAGNFVQTTGARLAFQIGSPLSIAGTASLAGELQVIGVRSGYVRSSRETVLVAAAGRSGEFAALSSGPGVFLTATLGYDPTSAWLDITRLDVTAAAQAMALSAVAQSGAVRLEGAFDALDGGALASGDAAGSAFRDAAGAIQRTPSAQAAERTLSSLSGELHAADATMVRAAQEQSRHALEARFDALQAAPAGGWAEPTRLQRRLSPQLSFDGDGWRMGHDHALGAHWRVGAAMAEARGVAWHEVRRDREHNRQLDAQLYAAWLGDRGRYAAARLGYGRIERALQRDVLLGEAAFDVGADYAARYRVYGLQLGQRFGSDAAALTPYLGWESLHMRRDGFDEAGAAAGFALRARDSAQAATQAIAGLRFESPLPFAAARLRLHGRFERQRTLSADDAAIAARFTALDLWTPIAAAPDGASSLFALGLDARLGEGGLLQLGIDRRDAEIDERGGYLRWMLAF